MNAALQDRRSEVIQQGFCLFWGFFMQSPQHSCMGIWRVTHNEGVLPTHDDHGLVDDPEQRHHDVLDVLEGFSLWKTRADGEVREKGRARDGQALLNFLKWKRSADIIASGFHPARRVAIVFCSRGLSSLL